MSKEPDYRDLAPSRDLSRLLTIMQRLRDPEGGCPWDIKQTYETIVPYTIEEAYEVKDAIERADMADLCDELGDLLLQVVYHAQIASERGDFDFGDVVEGISRKMLHRHPHVFGTKKQRENGMQPGDWERIKAQERAEKSAPKPDLLQNNPNLLQNNKDTPLLLQSVPSTLPALSRALKLQKRAATVGFDWDDINLVFDKLREEFAELEEECQTNPEGRGVGDELGDILFVAVNLARHLHIDPETALNATNLKFIRRFTYIEKTLLDRSRRLQDVDLDVMEALWIEAKTRT